MQRGCWSDLALLSSRALVPLLARTVWLLIQWWQQSSYFKCFWEVWLGLVLFPVCIYWFDKIKIKLMTKWDLQWASMWIENHPSFFAYFNGPRQDLFRSDLMKSQLHLCLCFFTERDSRLYFFPYLFMYLNWLLLCLFPLGFFLNCFSFYWGADLDWVCWVFGSTFFFFP